MILAISAVLMFTSVASGQEYGPDWEEHCSGNTCTRTLYSGIQFVFEDSIWKPITEAKSLLNVWDVVYLETDSDFDVKVLDFNYSSVQLEINFKGDWTEYSKECKSNVMLGKEANCNFSMVVTKTIFDEESKEYIENKTSYKESFEIDSGSTKGPQRFTYNEPVMGVTFKFGGNSTLIVIRDPSTGNVEDTYINQSNPTANYTTLNKLYLNASTGDMAMYAFIKFNISSIPKNVTITGVTLQTVFSGDINYRNVTFYSVRNESWVGNDVTWNVNPCKIAGACVFVGDFNYFNTIGSGFKNFTITNTFNDAYVLGYSNFSLMINESDPEFVMYHYYITSREGATESTRPTLFISYYSTTSYWSDNQTSTPSEYTPYSYSAFNISWNTLNESLSSISLVYIEANWTGSMANYTIDNSTYGGHVYNYTRLSGAGCFQYRFWSKTFEDVWNMTDSWIYIVAKNSSTPIHTNISDSIDSDASFTTTDSITIGCDLDYSGSGNATLFINGTGYTNPTTQTWGAGIWEILCNTSGSGNYTSNATGINVTLTITASTGGGGGGPSFIPECGSYIAYPSGSFTGFAAEGDPIPEFRLQITNGNVSQYFSADLEGNITDYCTITESPGETIPANGFGEIVIECIGPPFEALGHLVIMTDTGCEDSRPINLNPSNDIIGAIFHFMLSLVTGGSPGELNPMHILLLAIIAVIIIVILVI